jgi:hypothetical protein
MSPNAQETSMLTAHDYLIAKHPKLVRETKATAPLIRKSKGWNGQGVSKNTHRKMFDLHLAFEFKRFMELAKIQNPAMKRWNKQEIQAWTRSEAIQEKTSAIMVAVQALINQHLSDDKAFNVFSSATEIVLTSNKLIDFMPGIPAARFTFSDAALGQEIMTALGSTEANTDPTVVYAAKVTLPDGTTTLSLSTMLGSGAAWPKAVVQREIVFTADTTIEDAVTGAGIAIKDDEKIFYGPELQRFYRTVLGAVANLTIA